MAKDTSINKGLILSMGVAFFSTGRRFHLVDVWTQLRSSTSS